MSTNIDDQGDVSPLKPVTKMLGLDEIKPYPKNAKIHNKKQIEFLKKIIRENGYQVPICVDKDNVIVTGHGRHLALKELANEGDSKYQKIIVHDLSHLTKRQCNKFRISENKSTEMSKWDDSLLEQSLIDIYESLDRSTIIDELQLDFKIPEMESGIDSDEVIPEVSESTTKEGDLWELGPHRVLCGDCTKKDDVGVLFGGIENSTMVFTDPPYGVDYTSRGREISNQNYSNPIKNDNLNEEEFFSLWVKCFNNFKLNGDYYICTPEKPSPARVMDSALDSAHRGSIKQRLIWCKDRISFGRSHYHYRHEPILYGWIGESSWCGTRKEDSVWEFKKPAASPEHPTMKPVDLISRAIKNSSKQGDVVYDPFLGSGSTLISSEINNRVCFGIEIEPRYCDVIRERYLKHMQAQGQKPEVKLNGSSWMPGK